MSDPFSLDGRVALVTGASSGLGRHFARTLAARGAKVALAARRLPRLRVLASEIADAGGEAACVQMDVTDATSVRAGLAAARGELGVIDVVVNNSGVAVPKPALEADEADFDQVLDTNLRGAWLVARETARVMVEARCPGSIVNIASILACRVAGGLSVYATSKAGLVQLTRALAMELARYRIRVNAIAPGYVRTEMNDAFFAGEAGQALVKRVPMRRIGEPAELDGALLLLASGAGSYMTGSVIVVDGGHLQSPL